VNDSIIEWKMNVYTAIRLSLLSNK